MKVHRKPKVVFSYSKELEVKIENIASKVQENPSVRDAVSDIPNSVEIIGVGSGRIVVKHPEDSSKVVKLGAGRNGYMQNKTEYEVYQRCERKGISEILVTIREHSESFSYIVMDRINCSQTEQEGKVAGPNSSDTIKKLRDNGIRLYEIETAIVSGKTVAYDYGILQDKNT